MPGFASERAAKEKTVCLGCDGVPLGKHWRGGAVFPEGRETPESPEGIHCSSSPTLFLAKDSVPTCAHYLT